MACDQVPCVVKEYVLDLPATPAGASPPADTAAIVKGSLKHSRPLAGSPLVDSVGTDAAQAVLAKLKKDFRKSNEQQCKPGCKCVKNKDAKAFEGSYDVPISTTFSDSNGVTYRAQGTVSIKTKDTPGKCFE